LILAGAVTMGRVLTKVPFQLENSRDQ